MNGKIATVIGENRRLQLKKETRRKTRRMEEADCKDLYLEGGCEPEVRQERTADRSSKLAEPREGGKQSQSV
jgi:hypothetical protein